MNTRAGLFLTLVVVVMTTRNLVAIGSPQESVPEEPEAPSVISATVPDRGPDYIQIGDAAFDARDFDSAVQAYTQVSPLEIPPDPQNRLAVSYFMLGRERDAEGTYRLATGRNRELATAFNNLGALYYSRRDYRDAENRFKDALEHDPEDVNMQDNLHAARFAREDSRQADDLADIETARTPPLIERLVGDVLRVKLLMPPDRVVELDDHRLRGDIFLARKMYEDAAVEYERSVRLDEYDPFMANKLGIAYLQLQRMGDAEKQYKRALDLNPFYLPALNNLGSLEQARQQYSRAMGYYSDALRIRPDWTIVLQNIGSLFFALERYEEGLQMYIRAIRQDPDLFSEQTGGPPTLAQATRSNESMTNFYMAKVFASAGNPDRTMSFLYRAVEEGFDDRVMLSDPVFGILAGDVRFDQLIASLPPL